MRLIAILLLCLTSTAFGQSAQLPSDTIPLYGFDATRTTPDPSRDDESFKIPDGQTVVIDGYEKCLDILVEDGGTLELKDGCDLHCRTLTVYGLRAKCFADKVRGSITIRDLPISPQFDPGQYGHGILVIDGKFHISGKWERTPFVEVQQEIHANETGNFAPPSGWLPGDSLLVPDTRQPATLEQLSPDNLHTEVLTIASTVNNRITLSQPVRHDHLGVRDNNGTTVRLFDVANLTRDFVIRSENPSGVRGHILGVRHADMRAYQVSLIEMGRTTTDPLQPGVNQIARYPWHFHHDIGRHCTCDVCECEDCDCPQHQYQGEFTESVVWGSPKVGVTLHGSNYCLVARNVIFDCAGVGIMTENPEVYGNTVVDNMIVMHRLGSGLRITERSDRNDAKGDHWHNRVGLGLMSAANTIRGNHIYCATDGIGMAGFRTTTLKFSLVRGHHADLSESQRNKQWAYGMPWNPQAGPLYTGGPTEYRYPFGDTYGNRLWGCWRGIETWTADSYPDVPEKMFPGLEILYCRTGTDFEDHREVYTEDWTIRGDYGQLDSGSVGIDFKDAYEFGHTHTRLAVAGQSVAYDSVAPKEYVRFNDCDFDCRTTIRLPQGQRWNGEGVTYTWEDCTFGPSQQRFMAAANSQYYNLQSWLNRSRNSTKQRSLEPVEFHLRPYRGKNLDLYYEAQSPDFEMPTLPNNGFYADWPAGVYSNQKLIELGTPILGKVMPRWAERHSDFSGGYLIAAPRPTTLEELIEWAIEDRIRLLERDDD